MALIKGLGGIAGGASLDVKDEGSTAQAAANAINFVGSGVSATSDGVGGATVTIPGGSASPTSPDALTGLYRWFKSDTGVTMDGSNRVSQWNDQSGNVGGDATQATTGNMPVYTAAVLDGYPSLRFTSASSQRLNLSLTSLAGSAYTIFLVTGRRSNATMYAIGGITGAGSSLHVGWVSATQWASQHFGSGFNVTLEAFLLGRFHIVDSLLNTSFGRKIEAYQDASTRAADTATGTPTIDGGGAIGMAIGSYWNGDIVEVVVYTRALTSVERAGVRAYLAAKYPSASAW